MPPEESPQLLPEQPSYKFDPNALVDFGGDIGRFEEMSFQARQEAFHREERASSQREALASSQERARDFATFADDAALVSEGEFAFTVEPAYFSSAIAAACAAMGIASSRGNRRAVSVRIALFPERVKLTAFRFDIFFATTMYIKHPVRGLADGQRVAFLFDLWHLNHLLRPSGSHETLTFIYDARRNRLSVKRDGVAKLKLTTSSGASFTEEYLGFLGSTVYKKQFDPRMLGTAISYSRLFAERNNHQPFFSQIEICEGMSVAGTHSRIGCVQSKHLGLELNIEYRHIDVVEKTLRLLDATDAHLLDTENYHVLRNEKTCLGFRKFAHKFSPVDKFLTMPVLSRIRVVRDDLVSRLLFLSKASSTGREDLLVDLRVAGFLNVPMGLQTRDPSGKGTGVAEIASCRREPGEGVDPTTMPHFRGLVSLKALLEVVSFFDTVSITLEEHQGKVGGLRVQHDDDDFTATAFLLFDRVPAEIKPVIKPGLGRGRARIHSRGR